MKPDQWEQIFNLYHAALELPESERAAFLQTCIASEDVRREVASLLANEGKGEALLQSPALEVAARMMARENNSDSSRRSISMIGKTFLHYHIVSKIGQGGMGEVYQAKDLTLGRDVAIKVLPEGFAKDADRVARFQREAKLLASLNHTNIAAIHGLEESGGTSFLVLELVGGETLADQIKRGPIPVEDSLKLAPQIAEALEAAHEKGIIHRDLKPANIKVTPEGKVKVLDFGLAKAYAGDQEQLNLSNSPTLSNAATQQGVILGTAAYMSPEQARGKSVDKRADIWAFGCVLYEMLTGRAAFQGEDVSEILAAVIKGDIDFDLLPTCIRTDLRKLLRRCLQKDPKKRYRDIGDVLVDVEQLAESPATDERAVGAEGVSKFRLVLPWVAAAVVFSAIAIGWTMWALRASEPHQVMRFFQEFSPKPQITGLAALAISADGKQIAYTSSEGLYLRFLNEFDAKLVIGTETNPANPFFSPDGKWIGYWSGSDRKLKKIAVIGGSPTDLCDAGDVLGASWGKDDRIVYAESGKGILRISANGGTPEVLVSSPKKYLLAPQILPDGKTILFTSLQSNKIVIQPLKSGEPKALVDGDSAHYLPTGHIVYMVRNSLFAVPFKIGDLEAGGSPATLIEGVFRAAPNLAPQYAVSDSGTLVYIPGTASVRSMPDQAAQPPTGERPLVWVDRRGKEVPIATVPDRYGNLRVSPDGKKLAVVLHSGTTSDIYVVDLLSGIRTRITFNEGSVYPLWTRDGKRIAFFSNKKSAVYWKAADGDGEDERLSSEQDLMILYPSSWSDDGKTLLMMAVLSAGQYHIGTLTIEGDRAFRMLLQESENSKQARISPNGRWMAYTLQGADRSEVYVRPFPNVARGKWQVSTSGGEDPLWSPDGRELFYRNGDSVMAVAVQTETIFQPGKTEALFQGKYATGWDVSPDGKRFLMMKEAESTASTAEGPRKINIVVNWLEELKQRVPVK